MRIADRIRLQGEKLLRIADDLDDAQERSGRDLDAELDIHFASALHAAGLDQEEV
ncbi:hypothetical protein [Corynebacterium otitidis]|uniref:hypothetical protein n=1 Tax=Corynebacterium otitidis TaxID=29321 RepID=UPI0012FF3720|nr:hypothetical protein [Corynebacterium otitidis]